jgi:hypothetical protein
LIVDFYSGEGGYIWFGRLVKLVVQNCGVRKSTQNVELLIDEARWIGAELLIGASKR